MDGLILATAHDDDHLPDILTKRGVPFVLALKTDGKSLSSIGDDRLGGYLAARHLLDLGHRRVGIIAGPGYASSARGRQDGYLRVLAEQGIDRDADLIVDSTLSIDAGTDAALTLMRLTCCRFFGPL